MTIESQQIAAIVDRFPPDIRKRLVNSTAELAAIYRAGGVMEYPMLRDACDPDLRTGGRAGGGEVIVLAERAARHA